MKSNDNIPVHCFKWNIHKGSLQHSLWKCEEIQEFFYLQVTKAVRIVAV